MIVEMKKYRVLFVVLCIFFPMMLSAQDYFTKIRDLNMDLLLGKSPSAIKNEMESAVLLDEYSNKEGHIDYILKYKDRYNIRYIYGFDNKRLASISMTLSKNDFTTALILDAMSKIGYWHDMSESFNDVSVWRNTTFNTAIAFSTSYFDVSMEFYKDYGFCYYTKEDVERLKVQEETRRQAEIRLQEERERRKEQERILKRKAEIEKVRHQSLNGGITLDWESIERLKNQIRDSLMSVVRIKNKATSADIRIKALVKIDTLGNLSWSRVSPLEPIVNSGVYNVFNVPIISEEKVKSYVKSKLEGMEVKPCVVSVADTTMVVNAVVELNEVYKFYRSKGKGTFYKNGNFLSRYNGGENLYGTDDIYSIFNKDGKYTVAYDMINDRYIELEILKYVPWDNENRW